ncbi:MAG TPA: TonB-dependent receptor [Thermoanaerobaculia bacterium]|jgi:outer membrane receptor protein involved in Fe transport
MILAALVLAQTVTDSITVTATRTETRVADTPASVVVLSREALQTSAAPTLDEALRQVAGFTLFRRSGSRVANPTTQGVTLRGVGASGASRALVLDDGVPLNDPFGGWVYWGRVPRAALQRAEVLRGGASDLYGSSAMGGVIQFVRRTTPAVDVDASAGSQGTAAGSLFAGMRNGSIAASVLRTNGYVLVRPEQRGAVDVEAGSRYANVDGTLRRGSAFLRGSYYDESRENGTPLQVNDTTIRQLAGGADATLLRGVLSFRAYASDQDYFQTFSTVAADRNSERLTIEQSVPSRGLGGSVQWARDFARKHTVVGGFDLRAVRGRSDELRFAANGTTSRVSDGGRQRGGGLYLEDVFTVTPSLSITGGVRGDFIRNEPPGSTEHQLNPRLSLLWRANDRVAFSAAAYSAFRAATLNELYRGFRVGNIVTLANPALRSENMTGYELGVRAGIARLTLFEMNVDDAIANVTIGSGGGTITRQRQNIGATRSRGAELDADWRISNDLHASLGWLYVDATVRNGALRGNRVPQVPRNQATAQLAWRTIAAQLRWSAPQFDDDLNQLRLRGYFVADLFASHPLTRGLEVTAAVENLFDRDVEASATPVITLGQPRAWRVGLRYAPH